MIDWSAIIEKHGPDVWRTAYRLLSSYEDASDCYQETFLSAVTYAQSHRVACWSAALKRIATARAIDQLRRRYRSAAGGEPTAIAPEPIEMTPMPDEWAQLQESMEALREGLSQIPKSQAEVFWLSEVEMLSHADISAQLGATLQQVATWLHRSKRKLRRLLIAKGVHYEVRR